MYNDSAILTKTHSLVSSMACQTTIIQFSQSALERCRDGRADGFGRAPETMPPGSRCSLGTVGLVLLLPSDSRMQR